MSNNRLDMAQSELTVSRTVVRRFSQGPVLAAASSLSYTSLLAIVPLFAVAFR
ncbi:MAG: hypothetical protein OSB67_09250 [Alphaproteobacteria bacterium]|nr:hypothetical protein [Alphaproteobacteria bacterium]